jgi:DNA-binding MarR family transcriptional regulator
MSADEDLTAIGEAVGRMTMAIARPRIHELIAHEAGVQVDRTGQQILSVLYTSGRALRISAIAEALHIEGPHATRQVQRLEAASFVRRVPDPDDRRASLIDLTPTGVDAMRQYRALLGRWLASAMSDWSPTEIGELARLIERMADDWGTFIAEKDSPGHRAAGRLG